MPILVPMSDLLGVSRQVTVLAYQFGAGVINHILPTDGTLMAVLALAGVRFDRWFRFAAPGCAVLFVLGLLAITVAVVTAYASPPRRLSAVALAKAEARSAEAGQPV